MKKLNLLELMENNKSTDLPVGSRIVDTPEVIDIRKDCAEMTLVIAGFVTVVATKAGKKNVESLSMGQACFFDEDDECVIAQEGSVFLLISRSIHQKEANSAGFLSRFGKKKIEKIEKTNEVSTIDIDEMEEEKEKRALLNLMPRIKKTWYQVAGPISAGIVSDEKHFKGIAATVYAVLPMPIRLVVKEDFLSIGAMKNATFS